MDHRKLQHVVYKRIILATQIGKHRVLSSIMPVVEYIAFFVPDFWWTKRFCCRKCIVTSAATFTRDKTRFFSPRTSRYPSILSLPGYIYSLSIECPTRICCHDPWRQIPSKPVQSYSLFLNEPKTLSVWSEGLGNKFKPGARSILWKSKSRWIFSVYGNNI